MTPELFILKGLLSRDVYDKYYIHTLPFFKSNKEINNVLNSINNIYEQYKDIEHISLEELALHLNVHYKDDVYKFLISKLENIEVNEHHLIDILSEIKNRHLANDVAILALQVSEGQKSVDELKSKIEEFDEGSITESFDDLFVTNDLELLYQETVKSKGLRWRLFTLNRMLGSLRKGDFGFIFARPETAKTTFLASEVTYFLEQTEQPILWFNNEERGEKVSVRCHQAALGISEAELYSNIKRNKEQYEKLTGNRIRIFDSANIHRKQVEHLCKQLRPALVVFDQIDKIKGFNDDREDLRLGSIYIWARELAKEYCPVIGVCQANGDAEGKPYLTMDSVSNARTSKQAEADWILGIGKRNDEGYEFVRYLHLSKNKLSGDEDTDPELRHGKCEVRINPLIARYSDKYES